MRHGRILQKVGRLAPLAALAVIVGLGLCLIHTDDLGTDDACVLLAATGVVAAPAALPLPVTRFAFSLVTGSPADFSDRFAPPPEPVLA